MIGNAFVREKSVEPLGKVAPHLYEYEVECPCGCGFKTLTPGVITLWVAIRERVGAPIRINSGCRCKKYNNHLRQLGYQAAKNSRHLAGDALDLAVPFRWTARAFGNLCDEIVGDEGGVGRGRSFVHIDARGERKRWGY